VLRLAAALALVLAVPASAAAAPAFPLGVAAGEVRAESAVLWTSVARPGTIWAEVSAERRFRGMPAARVRVPTARVGALIGQRRVVALAPGRRYWYRFRQGRALSPVGSFRTAPGPSASVRVRFAYTGDADGTRDPRTGRPAYNGFEVYGRMAAEGNDFNINLGDTIYSDSEVGGVPPALTVAAKAAKYRENLGFLPLRRLRAATGLYSHWDDHEFINDFTLPEHGAAVFAAGRTAFAAYAPVAAWTPALGLYRSVRWGRTLELFFLDERSFRSARARAVCRDDLAPTAPQAVRNAFTAIAPGLAQPVDPACLAAINDPGRTMLGARQYTAFTRAIAASTATWKVVVNEVPIQQFYALPYDRWEGYAAERERLLAFLQQRVRNVVFLTTDTHANFVNEIRLRSLDPAGPGGTGIWEVITGPVATNSYSREVDEAIGVPGAGAAITGLFLKVPPPRGPGMACAAPDVYSYAQVVATSSTLTVTPKDAQGRLVREPTGGPCGPFVFRAAR
jgi:alkaline phosphatase D